MNWDVLHELLALQDHAPRRPRQADAGWTPCVDLLETESSFLVVVELAGLVPEDFTVSATADGLQLSGQRRAPAAPPERYLQIERGYGRFSRTFAFAAPVDIDRMHASYERGLLSITVPKALASKRSIAID